MERNNNSQQAFQIFRSESGKQKRLDVKSRKGFHYCGE